MVHFNADRSVNNSVLSQLEIFADSHTGLEKPKTTELVFIRKKITVTLTGTFDLDDNGGTVDIKGGKITGIDVTVREKDTWQITEMSLNINKFLNKIEDGNLSELISDSFFNSRDDIDGSFFDDKLFGFNGNDTIRGWNGDDEIHGGRGNDVLLGGVDKDAFVFDTGLNPQKNVDSIRDYNVRRDSIWLDQDVFSAFTETGVIAEDQFVIGDNAKDAEDRIVYWRSQGKIYYDADGEGGESKVLFAKVAKHTDLTHADFIVIT